MKHTGTQTIETQRLVLRRFKLSDAQNMFDNYCSRDKVTEFLTWSAHKSIEDTKSYLSDIVLPEYEKESIYRWAIVWKENNEVIGCIDARVGSAGSRRATLGWVLGDAYWGKGIMPEAAESVVKYLFSVGYERIQAIHEVANIKSGRVMQKIGMQYEGTLRKYVENNKNVLVDCCMYAITKS